MGAKRSLEYLEKRERRKAESVSEHFCLRNSVDSLQEIATD